METPRSQQIYVRDHESVGLHVEIVDSPGVAALPWDSDMWHADFRERRMTPPAEQPTFWQLLLQAKRWWLAPILIFFGLLTLLLLLTETTTVQPFIYALF